jgi:hypothetical protein
MNAAIVPGCGEPHQEKDAGEDVGDVQGQKDGVQYLAEVLHLRDLSHIKDKICFEHFESAFKFCFTRLVCPSFCSVSPSCVFCCSYAECSTDFTPVCHYLLCPTVPVSACSSFFLPARLTGCLSSIMSSVVFPLRDYTVQAVSGSFLAVIFCLKKLVFCANLSVHMVCLCCSFSCICNCHSIRFLLIKQLCS